MFLWVEPFMWWLCRVISYGMELVGVIGLTVMGAAIFKAYAPREE